MGLSQKSGSYPNYFKTFEYNKITNITISQISIFLLVVSAGCG